MNELLDNFSVYFFYVRLFTVCVFLPVFSGYFFACASTIRQTNEMNKDKRERETMHAYRSQ